jgi:1,4-alpha-glucan branching enzyme
MSQRTQRKSVSANLREDDREARAFLQGTDFRLYRQLGAHPDVLDGKAGVRFDVRVPDATCVSVIGDFNDWSPDASPLRPGRNGDGRWHGFVAGVGHGALYKFHVTRPGGGTVECPDPFARDGEVPPANASRVWHSRYRWGDGTWMRERTERMSLDAPWSIYQLHLGSWRRDPARPEAWLGCAALAATLPGYVAGLGFTHVALLPVTEHADYDSWGYRCSGWFRPSARYGTPDELRMLVDALHRQGIGVLIDWPAPQLHDDRGGSRSFAGSSALFWLDEFHVDGLRPVGCPAPGTGGDHGRETAAFLRELNDAIGREFPGARVVADDADRWPEATRPTQAGGLGFDLAWHARGVRELLGRLERDAWSHDCFTRVAPAATRSSGCDAIFPLSHDEVVPGHRSLVGRMPGDDAQRFAALRLLYGCAWTLPGRPLLFMGGEFAQLREWQPAISLDWHLLDEARHAGVHRWVGDLNRTLRERPALRPSRAGPPAVEWTAADGLEPGLMAFERHVAGHAPILVLCNFAPVLRENVRLGVSADGTWCEVLNSDAPLYGGGGIGNMGRVSTVPIAAQGRYSSLVVSVPPLAIVVLERSDRHAEEGGA